jgi:hypothetical protein
MSMRAFVVSVGLLALSGCTTYREELSRAQTAYDANEHDKALALTRAIEPNVPYLTRVEQTRYYYLRGMSNLRIGFRAEARHYLSTARAMEQENQGALPNDWKNRLDQSLSELNTEVYQSGFPALYAQEDELAAKRPSHKK